MQKTATAALQYLLMDGFSVIPIGTNKQPLIKWEDYQKRLPTEEEVEGWWRRWPDAGIGIITGKVSGITVVDIDVKHKEKTDPGLFECEYRVNTPSGGYHLYYKYSDTVHTCANGFPQYPYLDIRNDGGYVVAPPSVGYSCEACGELLDFPSHQFKKGVSASQSRFKVADGIGTSTGGRNETITRYIGSVLRVTPSANWGTDAWLVVQGYNQTFSPPLPDAELRRTFESIANKEKLGRDDSLGSVESPIQISDTEAIVMKLRKSKSGPYRDVSNVVFALSAHPDWSQAFRYDAFTKVIYFHDEPMTDQDVTEAQMWLQCEVDMPNLSRKVVEEAIDRRAHDCAFDSALDWLKTLEWDGVPRVDSWLHEVYGVENDEYHQKVGSNWLRAAVRRQVWPGSKYDHVLVIQGGQGVRKTTSFAALGKGWHVETTVQADSKDFLMQFDGKAIVEFSEGDTLNRSETKTLKAIITRTVDKYRAPYARRDQEYPRRCVFCMTTNESEFLKDNTGNRRWHVVNMPDGVTANVDWIEENREQLFAEAYARRDEEVWEVPQDMAEAYQDSVMMRDSLDDDVIKWYTSLSEDTMECGVKVKDFYDYLYANVDPERRNPVIPRDLEWRIKGMFAGVLKLKYERKRTSCGQSRGWFPTTKSPKSVDITGF